MELVELIKTLCDIDAPSGFEAPAAQAVLACLTPFCDEASIDRMGSVVGIRRCGKKQAKTLLIDAHIDQVGFLVSGITDEGFLRVQNLGGVDERMLPACDVRILSAPPVPGVFTSTPPHLHTQDTEDNATRLDELFIDTGLSADQAKKQIRLGTPVVFSEPTYQLSEDTVTGRALDDRAGAAVLLHIAERLAGSPLSCDLAFLFSSREETGAAGATTAAFNLSPDAAIAVDVSHAKTPDAPADKTFAFGGGVMVGWGPNLNRRMAEKLLSLAKDHGIPTQLEVMEGNTGTNAWPMQISRGGIPCALLSVPLRYMHTPIETVHLADLAHTADLICRFVRNFHGGDES